MINLKLYGLPRTYTNWVAYNIMRTWPDQVKVWMSNCAASPTSDLYWKHGDILKCPETDGYLFIRKDLDLWTESMLRYDADFNYCHPQIYRFVHTGWEEEVQYFQRRHHTEKCLYFYPQKGDNLNDYMREFLEEVQRKFKLPKPEYYHVETKKLWRNGDQTPLNKWLREDNING